MNVSSISQIMYSTVHMFGVRKFFNTFIQQGSIELIKRDSEDMYKVKT